MITAGNLLKNLHEAPFVEDRRPWGDVTLSDEDHGGDAMVTITLRQPARDLKHLTISNALRGSYQATNLAAPVMVLLFGMMSGLFLAAAIATMLAGEPGYFALPSAVVFAAIAVALFIIHRLGHEAEHSRSLAIMYRLVPDKELGRRPINAKARAVEDILHGLDTLDTMDLNREQYLQHQSKHFDDFVALAEAPEPYGTKTRA